MADLGLAPQDDPMGREEGEQEEEGEGDVIMPGAEDSSEEEEDDEEEARRVREGFIVDEDDDEDEEQERKRRRKRARHRRHEEDDDLEEDDLALLEENTGTSFKKKKNRLTRLRRRSESPPVASSSRRQNVVVSSDDDLDNDEPRPRGQDLQNIWDNNEDDGQDTDDFIDDSDDPDAMNDKEKEKKRKLQVEARRKMARARPELAGIDAAAWHEIFDVFGDGRDYDYALDDDDANEGEYQKPEAKFGDVFEPTAIRSLFLTEDDDVIRVTDIPERIQVISSTFSKNPIISTSNSIPIDDLEHAAMWITPRISSEKHLHFFSSHGKHSHLGKELVIAVTNALRQLFVEHVEVPFVWHHRRDYIVYYAEPSAPPLDLLDSNDLWRVYALGQKYCSLLERRQRIGEAYARLKVSDPYFEEQISQNINSAETAADTSEWLTMKYKDQREEDVQFRFHDDIDEPEQPAKHKMPSRISAYEVAKKSVASKLARQGFGISSHEIVQNFIVDSRVHFLAEQELNPFVFAEQFVDPNPLLEETSDEVLRRARLIVATELGKDPQLRETMRETFKKGGCITVEPTDQGVVKIGDSNPYFRFKYLRRKPVAEMFADAQFLHMLKAEEENLITISVSLDEEVKSSFERRLTAAFESDSFIDSARAWNEQGALVVREVMEQHLLPMGAKWLREYLRDEVEDVVARQCAEVLRDRINVAPLMVRGMKGDLPTVLAISWGKGDPHKDLITAVFLDPRGRMREHIQLDNLSDPAPRDELVDLLRRRQPDVIGISGFNMTTTKLMIKLKEIVRNLAADGSAESEHFQNTPTIYIQDEVARLYQHSQRAKDEFSSYPLEAKYCVGLARFVQSPLNEYAALGADVSTLSLVAFDQQFVPIEKLWIWCERVIIDVVNTVGVDVNRAVGDSYYQTLLPYVCGLGPRKAQHLVKSIEKLGENVINRDQFIKSALLTKTLFINASGFIRIPQQEDAKTQGNLRAEDEHAPDPLDNTRVHPEDYELARKMAMDALEYDEDDIHDKHPSWVVGLIMDDHDRERKLSELNLDEFATSLQEANNDLKRYTLDIIRSEFLRPFVEQRKPYKVLDEHQVLTMLSGASAKSLAQGMNVTGSVIRSKNGFVHVKLESGLEGMIGPDHISDMGSVSNPKEIPQKGQTVTACIIDIKASLEEDNFFLDLSIRPSDVAAGERNIKPAPPKNNWDLDRCNKDLELLARKKRAENDRSRRVIKHPNFHNFNTAQSEAFLDKQQRGDVVIRPSSKGADHLAVTWKVEDQLYQHIDVTEVNDPRGFGTQYIIDSNHSYSDLDELIVNHVQAMSRKVEELMAHDRFKAGSEDDLHLYLKNALAANPGKSMYGFTLNRKKPGHFSLCFLANKNSHVHTWPVRVTPEAYMLFDAAAVGVPELCDAFKVRHLHESQNQPVTGGRTPFGAGGRTPARPGGATPGHASIRQPARTPNPMPPTTYGGGYGGPPPPPQPQPAYGYQTPGPRPPFPPQGQPLPGGMNPQRAAMIAAQQGGGGGWGAGGWQ
ncbi:Transcription elongation factor Spt6 [Mycena kentingensis (nom. inval.)]|nr:Transcription elongation factor Spt6 [Mycena kentingensis (nom. inval.)]